MEQPPLTAEEEESNITSGQAFCRTAVALAREILEKCQELASHWTSTHNAPAASSSSSMSFAFTNSKKKAYLVEAEGVVEATGKLSRLIVSLGRRNRFKHAKTFNQGRAVKQSFKRLQLLVFKLLAACNTFINDQQPATVERSNDVTIEPLIRETVGQIAITMKKFNHEIETLRFYIEAEAFPEEVPRRHIPEEKIIKAQTIIRSWLLRRRFRKLVQQYCSTTSATFLRHRRNALMEIVDTERSYVEHLRILIEYYIKPMRELGLQPDTDTLKLKKHNSLTNFFRGKLSSDDVRTTAATPSNPVNTIASSVEVLYPLNVQFLRELEERMKLWPTSTSVGDIFIKFGPMMKLYSDFINNYERSQAMLKQLSEQQQFATFLKEAERKSRCRQDIHSLLIMPVQRLPRYQLLLKELLRFTHEEHVDYAHLKQASELATELNSVINENKRRSDCMAKMGSIQSSVEQIPFELVAPTRLFVDDVEATVTRVKGGKSLPRHLFLFSDCCILSTPFAHKKAKYCHSIHWTNDTVSGKLVDAENNKFGFFLEKGGGRKGHHARALNLQWQFWVQSEAVADAWLEKIETTLESFAINNNNSCANIAKVHPLVLEVQLHRANHLVAQDRNGYSDPYAKVKFKEYQLHSKVVKKSLDPEWNESFTFPFDLSEDVDSTLFVELWDEDVWRSHDFLGCCQVSLTSLVEAYKQTLKAERKKQLEARKSKVGGGGNKNRSKDEEDEGEEKGSQRRRRARSRTSPHSSPASSSSQPDESNKEPPQAEAKEMWLELDRAEHGKICLSMRLKGGVVPLHKTAFMVAPSPSASASSPPSSARRIAEREDATTNRTEAEEEEVVLELDLYQARVKMGLTSADGKQVLDEVKRWLSAQ